MTAARDRDEAAGSLALRVSGLSVSYGDVAAVHDVCFDIHEGECVALVGANGNGKSSIVMGVAGLVARRGRVEIFGRAAPPANVMFMSAARADPRARAPAALSAAVGGRQHHPRPLQPDAQPPAREGLGALPARAGAVPRVGEPHEPEGGHALWRPAADGRDRPRAGRRPAHPGRRRAVPGPGRGGEQARVRRVGGNPCPGPDAADRRRSAHPCAATRHAPGRGPQRGRGRVSEARQPHHRRHRHRLHLRGVRGAGGAVVPGEQHPQPRRRRLRDDGGARRR